MSFRLPALLSWASLWVISLFAPVAWPACTLPPQFESVRVAQVIDGDTLDLKDKTRVRLIGLDTPEIGHDGEPDDPGAREASNTLKDLVAASGWRVRLVNDGEAQDRHGRRLAHVFDEQGHNLGEQLLERGLAYHSPFPANPRFLECYQAAEEQARLARRGLWSRPPLEAARLKASVEGFERIAGRVKSLSAQGEGRQIHLEGGLEVRIEAEDLPHFDMTRLARLPGQRLEVHGWLTRHKGRPRMRIRHPAAVISPRL